MRFLLYFKYFTALWLTSFPWSIINKAVTNCIRWFIHAIKMQLQVIQCDPGPCEALDGCHLIWTALIWLLRGHYLILLFLPSPSLQSLLFPHRNFNEKTREVVSQGIAHLGCGPVPPHVGYREVPHRGGVRPCPFFRLTINVIINVRVEVQCKHIQ